MRYFLDTEFCESGPYKPIQLISIGLVCENGDEFYRVADFDEDACNDWVKANVLPHLEISMRSPLSAIALELQQFVERTRGEDKPEFWGYYADYDWVVFCQMFGAMVDLPKGWPMYCRDIKQLCDSLGNPTLPKQESTEHNALCDARWNKQAYHFLSKE